MMAIRERPPPVLRGAGLRRRSCPFVSCIGTIQCFWFFCRGVLSFRDIYRFVVGVCLMAMRSFPRKNEQTPEQLAARIKEREAEAARMVPGPARRSLLREISQLRACEEEKRWLRSSARARQQGYRVERVLAARLRRLAHQVRLGVQSANIRGPSQPQSGTALSLDRHRFCEDREWHEAQVVLNFRGQSGTCEAAQDARPMPEPHQRSSTPAKSEAVE